MPASGAFAYRHRLSVRFRDCDAMGHVNHAVYFTYLEQCRLTFWREATGAPSPHTRVIIARAECDYRSPARFGDELEVRLGVGDIGRSSFALEYEIVNAATGRRVATERPSWSATTTGRGSPCRCLTMRVRCLSG
jgi:acyl-CoA thioester hydrolase